MRSLLVPGGADCCSGPHHFHFEGGRYRISLHTATVPHWHIVTFPHCHTVKLPHCHSVTLPHCHTVSLPHCHTATLSHRHTVTLPHCHTAPQVKRLNPHMDSEQLTVENCVSKSFHKILQRELHPIWHQLSFKTRQLVSDLKTLRCLKLPIGVYCIRIRTRGGIYGQIYPSA